MSPPRWSPRRTIAGWPLASVIGTVLLVACSCWMIWATRTLVTLQHRRIVSVSLAALVQDFVAAEARAGRTSEGSASRTTAYLAAMDRAVKGLGREGDVVLVSEATLGRTVPDRTAEVRARIAAAMGARDDRR